MKSTSPSYPAWFMVWTVNPPCIFSYSSSWAALSSWVTFLSFVVASLVPKRTFFLFSSMMITPSTPRSSWTLSTHNGSYAPNFSSKSKSLPGAIHYIIWILILIFVGTEWQHLGDPQKVRICTMYMYWSTEYINYSRLHQIFGRSPTTHSTWTEFAFRKLMPKTVSTWSLSFWIFIPFFSK